MGAFVYRRNGFARIAICAVVGLMAAMAASTANADMPVYLGPGYGLSSDLNPLPYAPGACINASGTVVSNTGKPAAQWPSDWGDRALRWDSSGFVELPHLPAYSSGLANTQVYAINNSGIAVGYASKFNPDSNAGTRAVRWDASGNITELGILGTGQQSTTYSRAYAINSAGTAVGFAGPRAVRWDAGETAATELDSISGASDVRAWGINSFGTAIGSATFSFMDTYRGTRPVRWDAGGTKATALGTLGLSSAGSTDCLPYAINDAGTAVGFGNKYDAAGTKFLGTRAVRWGATATDATELGNLGSAADGRGDSMAYAINSAGTAVGYANKYDASGKLLSRRAVRWDADGIEATELANIFVPGKDLLARNEALAINAEGVAVGYAVSWDGLYGRTVERGREPLASRFRSKPSSTSTNLLPPHLLPHQPQPTASRPARPLPLHRVSVEVERGDVSTSRRGGARAGGGAVLQVGVVAQRRRRHASSPVPRLSV